MEAVLESVADEIEGLSLNIGGTITYPFILAFADDLIIVAKRPEDVELILAKLKEYLGYVGLKLNESKCKVLIREPNAPAVEEIELLGQIYKTTDPLRYLGITLTARLERPMTIRTRCRSAVHLSKVIMDFLRRYRPPWQVGRVIYESVIAPTMFYGTQVSVLTKYSRKSIRGYERQIVEGMAGLCRESRNASVSRSVNVLLRKRRITKKIRMYQMRWWGHVRRRGRSHPLRVAARLQPARRRSGRPGFTWWDVIIQNILRYGDLTYDELKELAMEKDRFHTKLEEIYDIEESDSSEWGNY